MENVNLFHLILSEVNKFYKAMVFLIQFIENTLSNYETHQLKMQLIGLV